MYSNTINIVHSNFRKKEPYIIYLGLISVVNRHRFKGLTVFFSISSKKYLKHFIMKLIEVELKVQAKLKVAIMILPTLWPTAAWGSQWWTILHLESGKVFHWELW